MKLRFRSHVRASLAAQLIRFAWWSVGCSGVSAVFFRVDAWIVATSLISWAVLQVIAHVLLALDDDDDQSQ